VKPVPVPHTVGNTQPLTEWNGRLAIAAVRGCEGPDVASLLWFDPVSKAEQVLWSPRRGDRNAQFIPFQQADVAPTQAGLA
jgi:hypothetical protein